MRTLLAILILIITTILLQVHSLSFWSDRFVLDNQNIWSKEQLLYISMLLSVTIEVVAIFAWLNKKHLLAITASAIVISVPLVQISMPIFSEITKAQYNKSLLKINELKIVRTLAMQDKLMKYNLKRFGSELNKTNVKLDDLLKEKEQILTQNSTSNIFIIVLEIISLLVVFHAQITSVKMLQFGSNRKQVETVETPKVTKFETVKTIDETFKMGVETDCENKVKLNDINVVDETVETKTETQDVNAKHLLLLIENYLRDTNISQSKFARQFDISNASISRLRKRVELDDDSIISDNLLSSIRIKFVGRINK